MVDSLNDWLHNKQKNLVSFACKVKNRQVFWCRPICLWCQDLTSMLLIDETNPDMWTDWLTAGFSVTCFLIQINGTNCICLYIFCMAASFPLMFFSFHNLVSINLPMRMSVPEPCVHNHNKLCLLHKHYYENCLTRGNSLDCGSFRWAMRGL